MKPVDIEKTLSLHAAWLHGDKNGAQASLKWANLAWANLKGADLRRANLAWANLKWASLRQANLKGADLLDANLDGADLMRAIGLPEAPKIPHIDAAILEHINGGKLDMRGWHSSCGTTHCRGGWAIHLAGDAGLELEHSTTPYLAALLIYEASRPGISAPDFYASNEFAMQDLRSCAERDPIP